MLNRLFGFDPTKTTVRTEIIAAITGTINPYPIALDLSSYRVSIFNIRNTIEGCL